MADHRVLDHLGLAAGNYDVAIRRYIPAYEQMIATTVSLVDGYVIDLGTGTGALAAAILEAKRTTRVRMVDIDPAMLETARARVVRFGDRAEPALASFDEPLPPCDAVVASLALHHVPEREKKTALYRRLHQALRPGGILAIADATVHEHGPAHDRIFEIWAAEMSKHGIDQEEADGLFAKWAGEDRYYPLAAELDMLAEAGFEQPECFWKYGPMTVYGGYR